VTARPLAANVVVLDEAGDPVVLEAGSEVPKEYADQVGDHCFEQDEPAEEKKTPARKRQGSS
jgi:hypothetical protein